MNHRLARLATDGKWQVQTVPLGWDLFSGHRLTHLSILAELAATTTSTPPTAPQLIPLLQAANWLRLHVRAEDRPAFGVAAPNLSRHLAGTQQRPRGQQGLAWRQQPVANYCLAHWVIWVPQSRSISRPAGLLCWLCACARCLLQVSSPI